MIDNVAPDLIKLGLSSISFIILLNPVILLQAILMSMIQPPATLHNHHQVTRLRCREVGEGGGGALGSEVILEVEIQI